MSTVQIIVIALLFTMNFSAVLMLAGRQRTITERSATVMSLLWTRINRIEGRPEVME